MTPERWRQIEELYNLACDRGEGVLEHADPELRREVRDMLMQESGGKVLDQAAFEFQPDPSDGRIGAGPVQDRSPAWRGRHGRGVSCNRHAPRSRSCNQS